MRPINKKIDDLLKQNNNYTNGNFGLYFNKFVEINDNGKDQFKPDKDYHYTNLKNKYDTIKNNNHLLNLLKQKHSDQKKYLEMYEKISFKIYEQSFKLKSPLIVGIGETNPGEVGMVFDRTLGIPYIPASSIKGVTRFAHLLDLLKTGVPDDKIKTDKDGKKYFDQNEDWTKVVELFGGDKKNNKGEKESCMGQVIFLDAYPDKAPELNIDIMNPHYVKYYEDKKTPPADYCEPRPIKFLTVAKGETFIFRFIAPNDDLFGYSKKALEKALFEEGIGAKTAVGYGRFGEVKNNSYMNNNQQIIQKNNNENPYSPGKKVKIKFKDINNVYINVVTVEGNKKGSFIKNQVPDKILKELQDGKEIEATIKGDSKYGLTFERL